MRWFKKIMRAILNLLPLFAIFFIVNGNTSALSYEVDGIPFAMPVAPLDFEQFEGYEDAGVVYQNTFSANHMFFINFSEQKQSLSRLKFPGKSQDVDNAFRFYSYWNGSTCVYNSFPDGWQHEYYNDIPIGWGDDDDDSTYSMSLGFYYMPSSYVDDNPSFKCSQYHVPFSGELPFDQNSLNDYFPDSFTNMSSWYWDNQNPYWYSSDGMLTYERHIDTSTGQSYGSSLYLQDVIGTNPNKFKTLVLPVYNSDQDSDCTGEFESGDTFEFNGVFQFDQPDFQWNSNLDSTSEFKLRIQDKSHYRESDCITNLITVNGYQQLEFTCSISFDFDPDIFVASIRIYAGDNADYVWDASPFYFAGLKIITHNDDSPAQCEVGDYFDSSHILGDFTQEDSQGGGFFYDLSHLFIFSIPISSTPLGGLFSGYNNSQCASIPLISNLLHAEEEVVCPFFTKVVRDIATPILASASVLLLFGFLVRWLSSSSGNYYEDSSTMDFNDMTYTSSHRSKKR